MKSDCSIKTRIAKSLLRQRDARQRKRQILGLAVLLVVLFLTHTYFANLASPLKLIPQTLAAIGMGYVILCILSLRRFTCLIDFIDWPEVTKSAESQDGPA